MTLMMDEKTTQEVSRQLSMKLDDEKHAKLLVFTTKSDGSDCRSCDDLTDLAGRLLKLSRGRVEVENIAIEDRPDLARKYRVKRIPATVVTDAKGGLAIKFYGLPSGFEFAALLEDIADAANHYPSSLTIETIEQLQDLDKPVHLQVFVTPSCPYCPRAVRMAHQFSIANPSMVDAEMIESLEFPELAEKYSVMAVPKIIINDQVEFEGALPEKVFLYKIKQALGGN